MKTIITPPARREKITNNDYPSQRICVFFEEVSRAFENLPEQIPNIADVSGLTIAGNEAKINEILAALQASGLMAGP